MTMRKNNLKYGVAGILLVFAAAAGFMLTGCSALDGYGRLNNDVSVTTAFQEWEVNENYNYFIFGSDSAPDAIIGIDKKYAMITQTWEQVDPDSEQMKSWVRLMENSMDSSKGIFGAAIEDEKGNSIGVWYSNWRRAVVKMGEDGSVSIAPVKPGKGDGGGGCG